MQQAILSTSKLITFLAQRIQEDGDRLCEILTDEETGVFLVSLTLPMNEALATVSPVPLCVGFSNN